MTSPTSTITVTRACAGGHIVADADVVGMTASSPGAVDVYCIQHAKLFEHRLLSISEPRLQM